MFLFRNLFPRLRNLEEWFLVEATASSCRARSILCFLALTELPFSFSFLTCSMKPVMTLEGHREDYSQ